MKKYILVLCYTLVTATSLAQDYAYARLTVDPNNLLGIVNNPRTQEQTNGLDFDIEVGARDRHVGVYVTYGRFENIGYQNYAAGVDYYVNWVPGLDMSLGLNYGVVLRKQEQYYNPLYESDPGPVWGGGAAIAFRATTAITLYKNIKAVASLQYQDRPVINQFVLEGLVGVQINLDR